MYTLQKDKTFKEALAKISGTKPYDILEQTISLLLCLHGHSEGIILPGLKENIQTLLNLFPKNRWSHLSSKKNIDRVENLIKKLDNNTDVPLHKALLNINQTSKNLISSENIQMFKLPEQESDSPINHSSNIEPYLALESIKNMDPSQLEKNS